MEELKINKDYQIVPIDSVRPDPDNSRIHDEQDIKYKRESLKKFGFHRCLVVNSNTSFIAAGSGMWLAAKNLGYTEVPAIFIPMSATEAKALALADNKLSDQGRYNLDQFNLNIAEIAEWEPNLNWSALGFDSGEITLLLASLNTEITDSGTQIPSNDEDYVAAIPEENRPAKPVNLTKAQRELFDVVVVKIRESENDNKLSEGKIVEILSADYLAGH